MGSFYQNGIVANLHDFSYGTSLKGNYTKIENLSISKHIQSSIYMVQTKTI